MENLFDEFSKSLGDSVPRRESLRRLGAIFAGAVLSPLGLESAWAQGTDTCKAFCKCRNKTQQDQCLAACKACNGNTSRLGGSCGSYVCCSVSACKGACSDLAHDPDCGACGNNCGAYGETCCGNYCADLKSDAYNCGSCGNVCDEAGPYEYGACVSGTCVYDCVEGATDCGDGTCTPLWWDPANCGACGNACDASTPYCNQGICSQCRAGLGTCGGVCVDFDNDNANCGACGVYCPSNTYCSAGTCVPSEPCVDCSTE